jgi:hypothetical protein
MPRTVHVKDSASRKSGKADSVLFMPREDYKACIDGLLSQGIDRNEAVETLKLGMRELHCIPTRQQPQVVAA